jgi:hypothetical protein
MPRRLLCLLLAIILSACAVPSPSASPTLDLAPSLTITPTRLPPTLTPTLTITPSPIPTFTLTPTPTISLPATVYLSDPLVPIVLYHQFRKDNTYPSMVMKVNLDDFRNRLQSLYDAGYSLVRLEDWLNGNLTLAAGRRPLILSIDDAITNYQVYLTSEGLPSPDTGIGVLWQFYQEHPDFGFSAAVFANLNAPYDNPDNPKREEVKARALVWCIEHDIMIYNHLWGHPRLSLTDAKDIPIVAQKNDQYLRQLLASVNRSDLVEKIANIIALPEGIWPATKAGVKALLDYKNPEGQPLLAVMEAMTAYDLLYLNIPKFLQPPYSEQFDRYHIPRFDGSPLAIDYLVKNKDNFPAAQSCTLDGLNPAHIKDSAYLQFVLPTQHGTCPDGIYALQGFIFRVTGSGVAQLYP